MDAIPPSIKAVWLKMLGCHLRPVVDLGMPSPVPMGGERGRAVRHGMAKGYGRAEFRRLAFKYGKQRDPI